MIDDVEERLKTNTTLTNITVKQTDTNNDIRKLTQLCNFFRCCQGHEWSEACPWEDRFECCSDFALNRIRNRGIQLN